MVHNAHRICLGIPNPYLYLTCKHLKAFYFPTNPSTLALPGPSRRMVINPARYSAAFSPPPKKSKLCAFHKATNTPITSGMVTNLENEPTIRNNEQKNSEN